MMSSRMVTLSGLTVGSLVLSVALAAGIRSASPVAAAATGAVTGQVVWCAALPIPYGAPGLMQPDEGGADAPTETVPQGAPDLQPGTTPDGQQGAAPDVPPGTVPEGGAIRPIPAPRFPRPIPAGAVLVAVQGTSLNARTGEDGRFRIDGVPIGQYLTVAAGPVRGASTAIAVRPNVFLREEGQSFSVGRLSLGQQCGLYGPMLQGAPSAPGSADPAAEGDIP